MTVTIYMGKFFNAAEITDSCMSSSRPTFNALNLEEKNPGLSRMCGLID